MKVLLICLLICLLLFAYIRLSKVDQSIWHLDPDSITFNNKSNSFLLNYNNKGTTYELISMSIHSGGLNGGHYYAVCKNYLDGKWSEYNDSNVSRVPKDKLTKYSPYLLVYKRS